MTDKELRKLKRAELLEIMFYLQEELSNVKQENESLRVRVDELTKAALNSKTELSEDCMQEIIHAVKNAADAADPVLPADLLLRHVQPCRRSQWLLLRKCCR